MTQKYNYFIFINYPHEKYAQRELKDYCFHMSIVLVGSV